MDFTTIWEMTKPIVAGQVRTALAGVAGSLVLAGAMDASESSSFIKIGTGIVVYAVPAAWSWWQKVGSVKLLALMARSKPVASPSSSIGQAVQAAKLETVQ